MSVEQNSAGRKSFRIFGWLVRAGRLARSRPLETFITGILSVCLGGFFIFASDFVGRGSLSSGYVNRVSEDVGDDNVPDNTEPRKVVTVGVGLSSTFAAGEQVVAAGKNKEAAARVIQKETGKVEVLRRVSAWVARLVYFLAVGPVIVGVFRYLDSWVTGRKMRLGMLLSGFAPMRTSVAALLIFLVPAALPAWLLWKLGAVLEEAVSRTAALPAYGLAVLTAWLLASAHLFIFNALADGRLGAISAMKVAQRKAGDAPFAALAMVAAGTLLLAVGYLVFGVGLIITIPVTVLMISAAYYDITGEATVSGEWTDSPLSQKVELAKWRTTAVYHHVDAGREGNGDDGMKNGGSDSDGTDASSGDDGPVIDTSPLDESGG